MANIVFSLETGIYDSTSPEDAGKEVVLWTPQLGIFPSAETAIHRYFGLEIVEGDLKFFAADGSPLAANFSKEPSFPDSGTRTFFPGIYTLQPGTGEDLQTALAMRVEANVTPNAQIVVWQPTLDKIAVFWGWPDAKTMSSAITEALKILPPELTKRVRLDDTEQTFEDVMKWYGLV